MNALTRDPELNFFIAVGVLWVAWLGILHWRRKLCRALLAEQQTQSEKRTNSGRLQFVSSLNPLAPAFIPALALVNWLTSQKIFAIYPANFWWVFAGLSAGYLLTVSAMTICEYREESKFLNAPTNRNEFVWSLWRGIPYAVIVMAVWWAWLPILGGSQLSRDAAHLWIYGGFFLSFLLTRFINQKFLGLSKSGAGVELEDCPLRAEIISLTEQVRIPIKSIKLVAMPSSSRGQDYSVAQITLRRAEWYNSLRASKPTILLEMIRGMASSTLTAGFANFYATIEMQNQTVVDRWPLARNLPLLVRRIIQMALIVGVIMSVIISGTITYTFMNVYAYIIYAGGLLGVAVYLVIYLRTRNRRRSERGILRAAELWRNAEPQSGRTVEDYLTEIIKFNAALNPSFPIQNLLTLTMELESVRAYLQTLDDGAKGSTPCLDESGPERS